MFHVRAMTSGPWKSVDVVDTHGNKIGERALVMAMEEGSWCVDNQPVPVMPGLCVSFADGNDAQWFVSQGRAQWFGVEPGHIITFAAENDAGFYVRKKLGEAMGQREAEEYFAEIRARYDQQGATGEEDEDDMLKTSNIENKAAQKPAETKKAAPAPAPKGKGGKKGK